MAGGMDGRVESLLWALREMEGRVVQSMKLQKVMASQIAMDEFLESMFQTTISTRGNCLT